MAEDEMFFPIDDSDEDTAKNSKPLQEYLTMPDSQRIALPRVDQSLPKTGDLGRPSYDEQGTNVDVVPITKEEPGELDFFEDTDVPLGVELGINPEKAAILAKQEEDRKISRAMVKLAANPAFHALPETAQEQAVLAVKYGVLEADDPNLTIESAVEAGRLKVDSRDPSLYHETEGKRIYQVTEGRFTLIKDEHGVEYSTGDLRHNDTGELETINPDDQVSTDQIAQALNKEADTK